VAGKVAKAGETASLYAIKSPIQRTVEDAPQTRPSSGRLAQSAFRLELDDGTSEFDLAPDTSELSYRPFKQPQTRRQNRLGRHLLRSNEFSSRGLNRCSVQFKTAVQKVNAYVPGSAGQSRVLPRFYRDFSFQR
jgi:hypothetical protein